jgi:alkanesulfonate monooxygenase SsuD/methylene tetrahydromethanopterin reductase-like flavin-dependent oxidoreductase (luciferase family)
MELGFGAGWKRDEFVAYGYGFPETKERLARLGDVLEVTTRMLAPGRTVRATYQGRHASVDDAVNVPKPIQGRLPILVGGNGPNVTWRLAARFADELNLDNMLPDDVARALPIRPRFGSRSTSRATTRWRRAPSGSTGSPAFGSSAWHGRWSSCRPPRSTMTRSLPTPRTSPRPAVS